MSGEYPEYELDDDTRTLLISILEIVIMASNVQLDTKHQEDCIAMATVLGSRFGIDITMTTSESPSDPEDQDWPFSISISG